jgi:uncharacterized protein YbjT (DUF2867 family)
MSSKKILVIGATGKQGGALVEALLARKTSNFDIYGLTRDASSNSAKKLTAKKVTMIQGDAKIPEPIFKQVGSGVWGVFSVNSPGKDEEEQAIPLIDASVAMEYNISSSHQLTVADRPNQKVTQLMFHTSSLSTILRSI